MRRALLLIGSPKPAGSTSEAIGGYLLEQLGERGFEKTALHLHRATRSADGLDELAHEVDESDVVVLAAPLYVDSLPAPVIKTFEELAGRRRAAAPHTRPAFAAIVNSGFPEPSQSDTAIAICELFARDARLAWIGGFRVGGGGVIAENGLTGHGPGKQLTEGLQLAAVAIASGLSIPRQAFERIDRPLVPVRLYALMADLSMRWAANRRGVLWHLNDRPYENDEEPKE